MSPIRFIFKWLNSFFFNDDPLLPDLTLECRALVVQSMLRLEKKDGMFLANRDFKVDIKVPNIQ